MVLIDKFSSVCVSVVGKSFVLFLNSKRYDGLWFGLRAPIETARKYLYVQHHN